MQGGLVAYSRRQKSEVEARIVIAMEDEYRAYREVIAAGIEILRPSVEVTTVGLDALEEEVVRLAPRLVVCSRPEPADGMYTDDVHTWVELPLHPTRPMKVRHSGHPPESSDSTLEALLAVIDGA